MASQGPLALQGYQYGAVRKSEALTVILLLSGYLL